MDGKWCLRNQGFAKKVTTRSLTKLQGAQGHSKLEFFDPVMSDKNHCLRTPPQTFKQNRQISPGHRFKGRSWLVPSNFHYAVESPIYNSKSPKVFVCNSR